MKMTLTGYASLFNQPDLAGDEIAPGAFTKTLAKRRDPVAMLYQHDATRPLAGGRYCKKDRTVCGLRASWPMACTWLKKSLR